MILQATSPALGVTGVEGQQNPERKRGVEAAAPPDDHAAPVSPTDEDLHARFLRSDREALGQLAQRHEANLLGLASGLLNGRRDLAMEAVQDTWLRVIKYAKSFRS